MRLLTDEFISNYPNEPDHMNNLGKFVFYRTYSRWLEGKGRRETFKEAIRRAVEYNVSLSIKKIKELGFDINLNEIQNEAELLFDNVFNLRQFLSGRTHWVGGADTKVADKFPLSNFNCSFSEVNEWGDLSEIFYLLLIGTGVGISCSKEMADNLPPIRRNYRLEHSEFNPVAPHERLEDTVVNIMDNGYAKIYVADSKEGWVESLKNFLELITDDEYKNVHTIKISYNSIRPKGEKLKTFGGTASGYEPLKGMFEKIDMVFRDELDKTIAPMKEVGDNHYKVRPIHILDVCNLIGNNVIVGGVRRTAEIFLCDEDDYEVIFAKYGINGIWDKDRHEELGEKLYGLKMLPDWWLNDELLNSKTSLTHRYMSNNSIMFKNKPSKELLEIIFDLIKDNGEPGFINKEEMDRRRPGARGINPCAEILLDNKQVCNLTTVNIYSFIKEGTLDIPALLTAQTLSVRAGMRMTLLDLELEGWDWKHKRDRLVGTSLTGWKDMIDEVGMSVEEQNGLLSLLKEVSFNESLRYANSLRIQNPLLITTVKPEGTLSQVAGGVSSGLHVSHSPYYIRRVRINSHDPLTTVAKELGWNVLPEVGQELETANTLVVEFPVKSSAKKTRAEQTLEEQFDTYFQFQELYTQHNSSNTITVKDDEWVDAVDIIFERWDEFVGVTFLPYDGGSYPLMPYEEITKEEYEEMIKDFKEFDIEMLYKVENKETEKDFENMESCEGNVCPII